MKLSHLSVKSIKFRLFLTCWLVFSLHFATDFVREHYLVLSIAEDFSFRLDKYVGLHADIFETPNHGAHHGANPGASIIAALPYIVLKPIVNVVLNYLDGIGRIGKEHGATYQDHRYARAKFYKQVRERGLDIKFGLVGLITMVFCMAPLSSLSAVAMFQALRYLGLSLGVSTWMAFLYAFGTPVFFRTAYLNQNLLVGIFGFMAFTLLWKNGGRNPIDMRWRFAVAGFLGGLALLCDYSGLVPLIMIYGYGVLRRMDQAGFRQALKESIYYLGGMALPVLLLWFYQWQSFGHPFFPGQHYMPPVNWIDIGYQGFGWPSAEILSMLAFDYRFGLFVVSPILLLAFVSPILHHFKNNILPFRESLFALSFFVAFILFFSGVQYTRLQWVTGIRYMVPVIPFLFLLTATVLARMPRLLSYSLAVLAFTQSWSMSMVRTVGVKEEGVMNSVTRIFQEGFQLPWLTTLSKMSVGYVPFLKDQSISPLHLFIIMGFLICLVWRIRFPRESLYNLASTIETKVAEHFK